MSNFHEEQLVPSPLMAKTIVDRLLMDAGVVIMGDGRKRSPVMITAG